MAAIRRDLAARGQEVRFVGIGGPRMLAEGLEPVADMDRLSINGFVEPVKRLPDLVRILRLLLDTYRRLEPDAFIGVDFNVFNFLLERLLKRRGVPTAHYVSPSVYAWRRGRVRRIARATELLLTLYPFEPAFYAASPVRAVFVGHPLADEIDFHMAGDEYRRETRRGLGIGEGGPVIAVLPGSRLSEVRFMGPDFLEACEVVTARLGQVRFVIPCLKPAIREEMTALLAGHAALDVTVYDGDARRALAACDVALVKSGTSTLEAMLLHRPMVVSYRLGELTYQLVRRLLRTPYVALPNILKGEELVPELLQHEARPEALAEKLLEQLDKRTQDREYLSQFEALHRTLRLGADERAADAVLEWLDDRRRSDASPPRS
jgi:lipid-A-disaccharide synthase